MTSVATAYTRQEPTTSVDESPVRAGALTSAVVDGDQAAVQALIFRTFLHFDVFMVNRLPFSPFDNYRRVRRE